MFQESSSKSQSSNDRGLSSHFEESLKLSNVTLIDSEVNGSISSLMSCAEIVTLLARHGCQDLTPLLSSESISQYPVSTGGFGDIYRGRLLGNHKVAIKTVRVFESCELGKYHKSAARELYTWSKCRHPNVVELMGLVTFRGSLAMVSVWAEHGTLPAHLKKNPSTDRCSLSTLICRGLVYLHANSIIHGDLKGDNVLISADGNPMLNDFGNASVQNASLRFSQTTTGIKYSTRWAAPEIIMETTLLTREADIYALGMTILVLKSALPQNLNMPLNYIRRRPSPETCHMRALRRTLL
ncbi:kinase-like domain-containing protein [Rhizoctonia solani]|nr:kinase-like domain-containing protein [Rhizoctonia solani]